MSGYTCKACGKPAGVVRGSVVRSCQCSAPVVAHMSAEVSQDGGIAPKGDRRK